MSFSYVLKSKIDIWFLYEYESNRARTAIRITDLFNDFLSNFVRRIYILVVHV